MCVIAICKEARLTEEQIDQMFDANPRGGGVAWQELVAGKPMVKWRKGLTRPEMIIANKELPFPYVLHFRVPSHGVSQSWLACHPFAIDENASYDFEGQTEGYVLFHNGLWTDWKRKMEAIAISGCCFIPSGPWSDSRALAWAAHHLGLGYLEISEEKVVALGPLEDDIEIFGAWFELKTEDDKKILVSNKTWERFTPPVNTEKSSSPLPALVPTGGISRKDEKARGTSQDGTFRTSSQRTSEAFGRKSDLPNAVQETTEEADRRDVEGNGEGSKAGPHGVSPLTEASKCAKCWKRTYSAIPHNGLYYCMQCWSDKQKESKAWIGQCNTCKIAKAGSKIKETGDWICVECWTTNGKPDIYFGRPGLEVSI